MLTERETEIASLVCCGLSNAQIGLVLGIQPKVVANHLRNIYRKKGIRLPGHCSRALLAATVTREKKERQVMLVQELAEV
jgi:DNA-binding NarL/FixJ family response regulator